MSIHKVLLLVAAAVLVPLALACGDDDDEGGVGGVTATPPATASSEAAVFFDCSEEYAASEPDTADFPVSVSGASGRDVSIEEAPRAIASLSAGHTEILYAIGAGDQVTAVDNTSDCPAATADLARVDAFTPSVESIVALEPDLVVLFFDPGGLVDALSAAGVSSLLLDTPTSVDGVYEQIQLLGSVTGHADGAEELTGRMRDAIEEIQAGVPAGEGPRVYHEIDNTYFSAGPGSFIDDLYGILGAENIAAATGEAFPQLSAEAIIQADPQVIILADEEAGESAQTVAARPGWTDIAAVVDGRVHTVDPDIVSRPGPRLVDALLTLAGYLYPEAGG